MALLVLLMIQFRLFLQNLWRKNNIWDEILSKEDQKTWNSLIKKWPTNVKELLRFAIHPAENLQLHVFTNASNVAYSAAIYVRNNEFQGIETLLILAKSRIASIKGTTISQLELLTIPIGVRAIQSVITQLEFENMPITIWSNSKCTLNG